MAEPIQHNGAWWHQQPDGSWLRWNDANQAWEPWAGGMGAGIGAAGYQPAGAAQPIHHNGAWWQQRPDGGWLRWNDTNQAWEPWVGEAQPGQAAGLGAAATTAPAQPAQAGSDDVFDQIRKLAELKDQGILSEEEFATKKQALLDKLG
jgi:hypothetical protein